jgi:mRNA interferase RelE/StbE
MNKAWTLIFEDDLKKDFYRLDRAVQHRIITYFEKNILPLPDPLILAKPLSGELAGLWRYRVGDYRIIVTLDHGRLVIVGLAMVHRREIYTPSAH